MKTKKDVCIANRDNTIKRLHRVFSLLWAMYGYIIRSSTHHTYIQRFVDRQIIAIQILHLLILTFFFFLFFHFFDFISLHLPSVASISISLSPTQNVTTLLLLLSKVGSESVLGPRKIQLESAQIWSQTGSKPNSITLSDRRQVRSWSQTCSEQKFGLSSSTSQQVCNQLRTCLRPDSEMEFGLYVLFAKFNFRNFNFRNVQISILLQ